MLCVLSFLVTLIREAFMVYSVPFLLSFDGVTPAQAASASSVISLLGIPSVIVVGLLVDCLPLTTLKRSTFPLWMLFCLAGVTYIVHHQSDFFATAEESQQAA